MDRSVLNTWQALDNWQKSLWSLTNFIWILLSSLKMQVLIALSIHNQVDFIFSFSLFSLCVYVCESILVSSFTSYFCPFQMKRAGLHVNIFRLVEENRLFCQFSRTRIFWLHEEFSGVMGAQNKGIMRNLTLKLS